MADETLRYDALVIGAGAGGLSAAALLAHHGYRTLLVEGRDRVGGRASSVREEGFTVNTGAIALEYGGLLEETFQTVGARFEIRVPEPAAMFRINHRNVDISSGGWGMLINGITKKGAGVDSGARGTGTCPRSSFRPGDWLEGYTNNRTIHAIFRNLCAAIFAVNSDELPAKARAGARVTSYLPSAHIADRWSSHYNSMVFGIQVTSVADARQIAAVLRDVRPTIWGAVPRVVEKLKAALEAGLAAEPDERRRSTVEHALEIAMQGVRLEQAGEAVPEQITTAVAEAERQVLSGLREKIGLDQAEWIVIGAAPMPRAVREFLLALGLPVTEIYGLSECACCVTVSAPSDAKIGSVGRALECVELALAEDGELLVRGETVMWGYRNKPEETAKSIDADGWLHTGDICTIEDGYVRVVDRKKELIINAGGKNMSPANIEQELKSADPIIGQAAVIGDARPYNVALLVLDPDIAAATAQRLALEDTSIASVARDPRVIDRIAKAVDAANAKLSRVEQIKRYELLAEEWVAGGDELTSTMKLKRAPIAEKHAAVIDALYAR